jgi:hypothetical protein
MTSEHDVQRKRWDTGRVTLVGLALAGVLGAGVAGAALVLGAKGTDAVAGLGAVAGPAVANANKTLDLCNGSRGAEVAAAVAKEGLCTGAAQVKARASEAGVPTTVTVQSSVDPRQLEQYAKAAAASYCAEHNECAPNTAVLVPLVADYLRAHPPTQPKPTDAQVRSAVQFVMDQNPDAFKGQDGTNGKDAPPVTDEQLAAQVAAYCSDGRCAGKDGPQGVGVADFDFQRDQDGVCQLVVILVNPADGTSRTVTHRAGDAPCYDPPPQTPTETTTTTEPAPLLGGR